MTSHPRPGPEPILTAATLRAGVWEGEIASPDGTDELPALEITHLGQPLDGLELRQVASGRWQMRAALPPSLIAEGVQTLVLSNPATGARIGTLTLIAGEALEDDLRAEVALLRAELDMLKKAFRRHCLETAGLS
ncbi:MAG: hypothetical protein H5U20_07715 [Rhodobacteraceae bacterium]|nr:hypothetical protein [Paracoccaceae bacterium]